MKSASIHIPMHTWDIVDDGMHNAFTDMITWQGYFWLAYVSSPSHFANRESRVVILRSQDAKQWKEMTRLDGNGEDIRDPKLAVIRGQIVLYALLNKRLDPQPYTTVAMRSDDGVQWSRMERVSPEGWLLGRPITSDHANWFAPAHCIEQGTAVLLRSTNGIQWKMHSTIHAGDRADETAIQFLPDEHMVAVTRIEAGGGIFGHPDAGTLISISDAPYTTWKRSGTSRVTRLDGPVLVRHESRVFALGRRQLKVKGPFQWQGSAVGLKRTALFLVDTAHGELVHITDLPSSGDTSYPGAVVADGRLFISYYSNPIHKDLPWILGMLRPTNIQMSEIELSNLQQ